MITENFEFNRHTGTVTYISPVAFMYSQVPLTVRLPKVTGSIRLKVECLDTGDSFEEIRALHNAVARFDLSKIMQYLAPDVTSLLSEQRNGLGVYAEFTTTLYFASTEIWSLVWKGKYGALNANESYRYNPEGLRGPVNRRLWLNFPQTFAIQRDDYDAFYYLTEAGTKLYPANLNSDNFEYENNLVRSLSILSDYDPEANRLLLQLKSGNAQTVGLSTERAINAHAEVVEGNEPFWLRLQPDLTPRDATGVTYLRWLQRDGSIGYWLFRSGELQTTSDAGTGFQRFLVNPNAPSYVGEFAHFDNALLADYTEARTLNLSAEIRNRDEYEYLCGLLTSPVVDRLVDSGQYQAWERVNIMPSSQSLSLRRDTPFSRTLELGVQLPRRDTIKL
jgi:hypothetical protein